MPTVPPPSAKAPSAPAPAPAPRTPPVFPREAEIPLEVIREWVAKYHPSVMRGDATIKAIAIIVDANENYVRSATGDFATPAVTLDAVRRLDPKNIESVEVIKGPTAASMYGPAAMNGVVVVYTKSFNVDTAETPPAGGDSVYVITQDRLRELNAVNPPVFIIDGVMMTRPLAGETNALDRLGVKAGEIENMVMRKMRGGVIGPNPLTVLVAKLK
jgi:TonB-dependent SusC/RagA subfamily outer membrane receptor